MKYYNEGDKTEKKDDLKVLHSVNNIFVSFVESIDRRRNIAVRAPIVIALQLIAV